MLAISVVVMTKPKVYFSEKISEHTIVSLFSSALADAGISVKGRRVALKTHFGEKGNSRFVSPRHIRPIAQALVGQSADAFLTDTNTLYRGMRTNSRDHLMIAAEHGFEEVGLPIIIADGEYGEDEVEVAVGAKHFEKVKIAKAIHDADMIIAISHFKGHCLFGFGGSLKNLGMGCSSRAGKLAMHSKIAPYIGDDCTGCGVCLDECDVLAITMHKGKAEIGKACIGCARCIAVCPHGSVKIPWSGATSTEAQQRCAEYAAGAIKAKDAVYVTFINNITQDCDCLSDTPIIAEDVGIMASADPVAIDKAAYDRVMQANGGIDIFLKANKVDGTHIIHHAADLGLGSVEYDLVKI